MNKRKGVALVIYVTPEVKKMIKHEAIDHDTWDYSIATEAILVYFKYASKTGRQGAGIGTEGDPREDRRNR
jgi:hypothetical protein